MNEEKPCSKCGQVKPLSEFHRDKKLKSGRASQCKPCRGVRGVHRANARRKQRLTDVQEIKNLLLEEMACFQCKASSGLDLYIDRAPVVTLEMLKRIEDSYVCCTDCRSKTQGVKFRLRQARWREHARLTLEFTILKLQTDLRVRMTRWVQAAIERSRESYVQHTEDELRRNTLSAYETDTHEQHVKSFELAQDEHALAQVADKYPVLSDRTYRNRTKFEILVDWSDEDDRLVREVACGAHQP